MAALVPGLARAQRPWPDSLTSGVRWEIVGGRLAASAAGYRQHYRTSALRSSGGHRETARIEVRRGVPRLNYEYTGPDDSFRLDVTDGIQIQATWRRQSREGADIHVTLSQESKGPIALRMEKAEAGLQLGGPTLWHLWIALPPDDRRVLDELLRWFRADWDVGARAAAIESHLMRLAELSPPPVEQWRGWVVQLNGSTYEERERATAQLIEAGPGIAGYLAAIDLATLSPEQRYRIQYVRRKLESRAAEGPEAIAWILYSDRRVWAALLEHGNEEARASAHAMLAALEEQAESR